MTEGRAVSLLKAQLALSALAELRAGERKAAARSKELIASLIRSDDLALLPSNENCA